MGSTRGGEVQLKVSYRVTQHVSSSANPPSRVALKAWHSAPEAGKHLSTASSSHSEMLYWVEHAASQLSYWGGSQVVSMAVRPLPQSQNPLHPDSIVVAQPLSCSGSRVPVGEQSPVCFHPRQTLVPHGQSDATQLVMLVTISGGSNGVQDALKISTYGKARSYYG